MMLPFLAAWFSHVHYGKPPTQAALIFMHNIQRDSERWTQFRMSIFPELYMVCE